MCRQVLIACESSGTVREAFRKRGHDAWSCDLLPPDDNNPFHLQGDAIVAIANGCDGRPWDLVIAFPPCTHLAASIAACEAIGCQYAVENPIGIMSRLYRKPDQIIQPWMFGHPETKATCLWLSGLPLLKPTNDVREQMLALPVAQRNRIHHMPPSKDRWKLRSKTYQGIANAMAEAWG